ncbi:PhoH family protein [Cyclobacterium qasimii]|uniref:Phosphate starvation-inducible protein PhoH, predicted ATPase n=2 Tax=Cyclobacterium qasimii TaxID=1350429 RepID=S7WPZ0_9BACT|nr:PhoH family protein [Cyclobacterium qasimii]EPR66183.1 Phosphate starvation-inducible protein PhoH, predicted ATPase [Cyclobacterium qasimii M12-11B]GEO21286.1 phosphate starvation protein PhoH [Cyclobacterium qasimii]
MLKKTTSSASKIFVLDTSVILYDHHSILNFAEHDVVIPITVLEELDQFKKGNDTKNFESREFIRLLDKLSKDHMIQHWTPLNGKGKGSFKIMMNSDNKLNANEIFGEEKNDHRILNAALSLKETEKNRKVVLVSKDINLRLKAKSLDIAAEDYETGKIKNISEIENTGKGLIDNLDNEIINNLYEKGVLEGQEVFGKRRKKLPENNTFYILKGVESNASILAFYQAEQNLFSRISKSIAYNISPKNAEQAFALHAILDPEIKLLTIQGVAGTGKTLLALAGALEQRKDYKQIFLARPIVPLSNKDIGYLPGDIKSKLNPYMEPLWDNLKFIQNQYQESDKEYQRITDMINQEKLVIQPLAYIRGRSLSNIFFIVDEAQNLTPHEVKTIISRAGENTKIVFTGDVFQIDTPYLDSQSNGLSYLIDRARNHPLYAHIKLEKGERSELANLANELL